jgi:hypothetical protein
MSPQGLDLITIARLGTKQASPTYGDLVSFGVRQPVQGQRLGAGER